MNEALTYRITNPFNEPSNIYTVGISTLAMLTILNMSKGFNLRISFEMLGYKYRGQTYSNVVKKLKQKECIKYSGNSMNRYKITLQGINILKQWLDACHKLTHLHNEDIKTLNDYSSREYNTAA